MNRRTGTWGAWLATALLLAAHPDTRAVEKVFRCGPDGREYSQTPCQDGHQVDVADTRSAEQRQAAALAVQREALQTDKMAHEQRAQEAAAAKQGATIIANPSVPEPAASAVAAAKKRHGKRHHAKQRAGVPISSPLSRRQRSSLLLQLPVLGP